MDLCTINLKRVTPRIVPGCVLCTPQLTFKRIHPKGNIVKIRSIVLFFRLSLKWRKQEGQTILYEEDTNEYMYIIFEGEVKVIKTTEEGKEIILAMHSSGDFFGEISLLDGKTIPAGSSKVQVRSVRAAFQISPQTSLE